MTTTPQAPTADLMDSEFRRRPFSDIECQRLDEPGWNGWMYRRPVAS